MTDDNLIKAKKEAKARQPRFNRTDGHKKRRTKQGWRRPKGLQSKMRLHRKGYSRTVKTGYGTPAALRGTTRDGLTIKRVENKHDLDQLDPKTDAALLGNLGRKKKEDLIKAAQEKGLALANLSAKAYQEHTKKLTEAKKRKKATLKQKAEAKRKKAEQEKQEQEAQKESQDEQGGDTQQQGAEKQEASTDEKQDQSADEEKKQQEKQEKDKVLTSKKGY